jgi:hypothetical protein
MGEEVERFAGSALRGQLTAVGQGLKAMMLYVLAPLRPSQAQADGQSKQFHFQPASSIQRSTAFIWPLV